MAKKRASSGKSGRKAKTTTGAIYSIAEALDSAEPRPPETSTPTEKKNYAERFSRHLATCIANTLRPDFAGILPTETGGGHESQARSRRALKKLDVNYSTIEMGLGLGVSIKTMNFRDYSTTQKTFGRFSKNKSRADNEFRAEATDYHLRQPYAVLVGVFFLPIESCDDGGKGPAGDNPSSFAEMVNYFRLRTGREKPTDDVELFERFFVGLYHHQGPERGNCTFFEAIQHPPPKIGRPKPGQGIDFPAMIKEIRNAYDERNNPPPVYADE